MRVLKLVRSEKNLFHKGMGSLLLDSKMNKASVSTFQKESPGKGLRCGLSLMFFWGERHFGPLKNLMHFWTFHKTFPQKNKYG